MPNKLPTLSIHEADVLQPWGLLNIEFMSAVQGVKLPSDWMVNSALNPKRRQDHFDTWHQDTLRIITDVLWPLYDRQTQEWQGASIEFMQDLTREDLELMLEMQRPSHGPRQFDQVVSSPVRLLQWKTHRDLFSDEDTEGGSHVFQGFQFYDRNEDDKSLGAMSHLCFQSDRNKNGNIVSLFKNHLQRPRPMQMALRFNYSQFEYHDAGTSITPSMCSGHCLQSMTSVGGLIERLLDDGISLHPEQLRVFAQWAVDIGDRRVMAGVHYPSDNIASWILFLSMCEHVFHRSEPKKAIAHAIREQSCIHRQLQSWRDSGRGAVYKCALQVVENLSAQIFEPTPIPTSS